MNVCKECVEDIALRKFVHDNAAPGKCDYCGAQSGQPIVCGLSEVLEFMDEVISEEFGDPNNELPYDSGEGGWQGDVWDIFDVFDEIEFYLENESLLKDIRGHFFDRQFCRKDYFAASPSERVIHAWDRFKSVVKHERRYTFWTSLEDGEAEYHPDHLPPGHMLREIADIIHQIGLVATISPGTEIWRVRVSSKPLSRTSDFTSPPVDRAIQPNRMSPAGVPMFYGSDDSQTAMIETVDPAQLTNQAIYGGRFTPARGLCLLDLTAVPKIDSFFAVNRDVRHAIHFLWHFASDLSRPIKRDRSPHIDYVPTQVFTEYVRFELKAPSGGRFDGLKYRSSRNGKPCYVVFATQDQCLKSEPRQGERLLQFVEGSISTLTWP